MHPKTVPPNAALCSFPVLLRCLGSSRPKSESIVGCAPHNSARPTSDDSGAEVRDCPRDVAVRHHSAPRLHGSRGVTFSSDLASTRGAILSPLRAAKTGPNRCVRSSLARFRYDALFKRAETPGQLFLQNAQGPRCCIRVEVVEHGPGSRWWLHSSVCPGLSARAYRDRAWAWGRPQTGPALRPSTRYRSACCACELDRKITPLARRTPLSGGFPNSLDSGRNYTIRSNGLRRTCRRNSACCRRNSGVSRRNSVECRSFSVTGRDFSVRNSARNHPRN